MSATVSTFRITNTVSGHVLGDYQATSPGHALDVMARDAGYRDYLHACDVVGRDLNLRVEELPWIEVVLDSAVGPHVTYSADDDAEDAVRMLSPGYSIDFSNQISLADGRFRAPIVVLDEDEDPPSLTIVVNSVEINTNPASGIDELDGRLMIIVDGETYTGCVTLHRNERGRWSTWGDSFCWCSDTIWSAIEAAIEAGHEKRDVISEIVDYVAEAVR